MAKQSFSKAALHKEIAQLKRYQQFLPFEQRRLDILNTAVNKAAQRMDFCNVSFAAGNHATNEKLRIFSTTF